MQSNMLVGVDRADGTNQHQHPHRFHHRHTTGQLEHDQTRPQSAEVIDKIVYNNNNTQLDHHQILEYSPHPHLVNGNEPHVHQQRQSSPLLASCKRRLFLHFNKAIGGGSKTRWTSPVGGTCNMDGQSKNRLLFFRRRKSAHPSSTSATINRIEDGPFSGRGPFPEMGSRPASGQGPQAPRLIRSPSADQIDYSNFVSVDLLEKHRRSAEENADHTDEHNLIAYNSSLLTSGTTAPIPRPYQIPPIENNANEDPTGTVILSGAHSAFPGPGPAPTAESTPPPPMIDENKNENHQPQSGGQNGNSNQMGIDSAVPSSGSEQERVGTAASNDTNASANAVSLQNFHRTHNRTCTSFRIKIPKLKNPVDACLLPDDHLAIADYDNGFLITNAFGDIVQHCRSGNDVNACGIAYSRSLARLFLLTVGEGFWSVNTYNHNYNILESIGCPIDAQIETWALRRLVMSLDNRLYLLASGESKSSIWTYELGVDKREWKRVLVEISGRKSNAMYNDMSVKYSNERSILLCEWKKAQLWTLTVNEKGVVNEQKSIRMKRVKGQEWIVQGPHLAILDENGDIVAYDASGKLFLFDGENYRCKKIIADVGRGEVSALAVQNGWVYALCRYRLCFQAYLYREQNETDL